MKKALKCIVVAVTLVVAVTADCSFVADALSWSDTCLLWHHGEFWGWLQMILYILVIDGFISLPAYIIWGDIDNIKC